MFSCPRTVWVRLVLTGLACLQSARLPAADWPQWMGPARDGSWPESGLLSNHDASQARENWRRELGGGYSGPAVVGDAVIVTDFSSGDPAPVNHAGVRDQRRGSERIWCLDAETGAVRWQVEQPCTYRISYASGPRATPTVSEGLVYCLGASGWLQCVRLSDGERVWSHDLTRYTGGVPWWGFSSHPLVEGELVICLVGGPGSTVVAFDRESGTERWRSGSASDPGYSAVNVGEFEGRRQLLAWDADQLRGLDPDGGRELWSYPLAPEFKMSIGMPHLADGIVFAGGKGRISAGIRLLPGGREVAEVWRGKSTSGLSPSNSPPVVREGVIYGCDCDTGHLRGVDLKTGDRLWESLAPTTGGRPSPHATAFLVQNGARWVLFNDSGDLIFADLNREGYTEYSRTHIIDPTESAYGRTVVWSHPAFAGGRVYVRSHREIRCVDLREISPEDR